MHVEIRSLALVLLALAPAPALAGETVKIPRPLPTFVDKPAQAEPYVAPFPPETPPALVRSSPLPKPRASVAPLAPRALRTWHGLGFDEPGDGRIWARGEDFKASFGREGATFIPFLGSDAPRNYPVTFRLSSVSVAGVPVDVGGDGACLRTDRRVTIERGVADEVYDLTERSVEQTITIESLPARGDLAIVIDVATDLAAHVEDGVVRFRNDLGGVDYGRVTVLDRDGRAFTTSASLHDGDLRIDVPASFVQEAAFPLRVDPVITTSAVAATIQDDDRSDLAYDVQTGVWLVAYEFTYSANDHDVYVQAMDSTGAPSPLGVGIVDVTTDYWWFPSVANNYLAQQFLVVAGVILPVGNTSLIRGRTVAAATLNTGFQVTISGTEVGAKGMAVVGGDPLAIGPTYYCVVWQRDFSTSDSDIHARLFDPIGGPLGTGPILIDNTSGTVDMVPSISKCDGNAPSSTQEWNVVWQRYDVITGWSDVHAAQVHWDGGITTASMPVDTAVWDDVRPRASSPLDVPSGPRPWMVAYTRQFASDGDIVGVSMLGGSNFGNVYLSVVDGTNLTQDQLLTGLDSDGQQIVLSFVETFLSNPADYDAYVSSFAILDNQYRVTESHAPLDVTGFTSSYARVAAAYSSGGPQHTIGASWSTWTGQPTYWDVFFGLYSTPTEGPAGPYCYSSDGVTPCPCGNFGAVGNGCANSVDPNGANLVGTGSHALSTDSFVLTATGLPATATCLFFQGTTEIGVAFGDGARCVGGTTIRLGIKTASGGVADYPTGADLPVSVKGLLPASGGRRDYQVWYRDSAAFCTPSSFNLTNGYMATWLP